MASKRRPKIAPRKPAAAPDAAAHQRFVEGARPGHGGSGGKGVFARADGRELARIVGYVPPAMKKRLEVWCIEHDVTVSDTLTEIIGRFLGGT